MECGSISYYKNVFLLTLEDVEICCTADFFCIYLRQYCLSHIAEHAPFVERIGSRLVRELFSQSDISQITISTMESWQLEVVVDSGNDPLDVIRNIVSALEATFRVSLQYYRTDQDEATFGLISVLQAA